MYLKKDVSSILGVVCIIGYGSIGKATLPLIKRHFQYQSLAIIDPIENGPNDPQIRFQKIGLTPQNYVSVLDSIFKEKKGFCVNLSVDTSSKDIMLYCQSKQILYIDTVVEQWKGFYSNLSLSISQRSNYAMRYQLHQAVKKFGYKSTAVSCCGANPGMVSWFVKRALLNIAKDTEYNLESKPTTRKQWAQLMKNLGIQGIHIAERDTQSTPQIRPAKQFWNTWSVDGFISQAFHQAAQLGWGTHQKWMPKNACQFNYGSKCAIHLLQPGMTIKVKSWCPTYGPQFGFLVTHNESISISDYYTLTEDDKVIYRPTCHYAYHPAQDVISSLMECLGSGSLDYKAKILDGDITQGIDQLGVLLYGNPKGAYWYGSQLTIQDTRKRAPNQNATGLQVSSAVIAGMKWALQNPQSGVVQCEQMDYQRCLQIQQPYVSPLNGYYTDWNPLKHQITDFDENSYDKQDPWQFKNVLIEKK